MTVVLRSSTSKPAAATFFPNVRHAGLSASAVTSPPSCRQCAWITALMTATWACTSSSDVIGSFATSVSTPATAACRRAVT